LLCATSLKKKKVAIISNKRSFDVMSSESPSGKTVSAATAVDAMQMTPTSTCPHVADIRFLPDARAQIHREECTKCFHADTDVDGAGIDVCLTCFNGSCSHAITDSDSGSGSGSAAADSGGGVGGVVAHNQLHHNVTKHPIVLRVKRTRINAEKGNSGDDGSGVGDGDAAAAAVAAAGAKSVGEAVAALAASPEYGTQFSVHCLACAVQINPARAESETLWSVIDKVLATTAATAATEAVWEEKRVSCEHCLTLQQKEDAPSLAKKAMAHCESCEIGDNLWLCLTCGALGCGRAVWGVENSGHGHALEHFVRSATPCDAISSCACARTQLISRSLCNVTLQNETKHPLVCKMGTITPDGGVSIASVLVTFIRVLCTLRTKISRSICNFTL
jgi:hypothetical protein